MRPDRRLALLSLLVFGPACPDPSPPDVTGDAGADAQVELDAAVVGPESPAAPVLTPCPAGWAERPGPPTVCEAFPGDAAEECPAGQMHAPGEPACRDIGAACPAGDFADDVQAPEGTVWYVLAGAPDGGAGTMGDPFGSVAAALDRAGAGDVVALSRGTFAESVRLTAGVTLAGACAGGTVLEAPTSAGVEGVVTVAGAEVVVRDLTLAGPRPGLWIEGSRRDVHLDGVEIAGVDLAGILVGDGATLSGTSVAIRDVRALAVPGVSGFGILADTRGSASLERVAIERTEGTAVMAVGAQISLTDASIRDQPGTQPDVHGVEAQQAADVSLVRASLETLQDVAVIAFDPDTVVTLQDVIVRGTLPRADGSGGRALSTLDARVAVQRARIEDQRELAVIADGSDATIELVDVVVRRVEGRAVDGGGGTGVAVQHGAGADLTRVDVGDSRGVGVIVFADSTATVNDLSIRETRSLAAGGDQGTGLQVQSGGSVQGARIAVVRARQAGIVAIDSGRVVLEDVVVDDTLARECAADACAGRGFGDGVLAAEGGSIELTRFRVRQGERVGVLVGGGSLDLHHGEVSGFPIGASIQLEEFDETRLFDDVIYRDNDRNLDRSSLPLPEPAVPY